MTCQICGHHRQTELCIDRSESFQAHACIQCRFPEDRYVKRHVMPEVSMGEMEQDRATMLVCLRPPRDDDAASSEWELRPTGSACRALR